MNEFIASSQQGNNKVTTTVWVVLLVFFANVIGSIPGAWATVTQKVHPDKFPVYVVTGLMLLGFAVSLIALWLLVKYIHQRNPVTLVTPLLSINWKRILLSGGLWLACSVFIEFLTYLIKPDFYKFTFEASVWFPSFFVGLALIPLQSWFEEMFFRGYLLQTISRWNIWVGIGITTVLFGLAHSFNEEIQAMGGLALAMIYYMGFGLFAALLTITDKKLELPMGLHAANNIYAFLIVGYPSSSLPTASIFTTARLSFPLMLTQWILALILYIIALKVLKITKFSFSNSEPSNTL